MDKILHFFYHFHALWLQRCGNLIDEPAVRFMAYQQNLVEKGENVMNKQNVWMRWLVTGLAVAAIAVAALAIAPLTSFAQTDSGSDAPATPAAPEEATAPKAYGRGGMGMHLDFGMRGGMMGDHQAYLAEALGITVEELQAAQEKAHAAMIAQAVEDGVITQEQADLMAAGQAFRAYMADADAQSMTDALAAAVEAGAITQEQADLLTEQMGQMGRGGMFGGLMERGMRMFGNRDGGMFNRGGRGDFHHHGMPGMPWNDGESDTTPQRGVAPEQSDSNL